VQLRLGFSILGAATFRAYLTASLRFADTFAGFSMRLLFATTGTLIFLAAAATIKFFFTIQLWFPPFLLIYVGVYERATASSIIRRLSACDLTGDMKVSSLLVGVFGAVMSILSDTPRSLPNSGRSSTFRFVDLGSLS